MFFIFRKILEQLFTLYNIILITLLITSIILWKEKYKKLSLMVFFISFISLMLGEDFTLHYLYKKIAIKENLPKKADIIVVFTGGVSILSSDFGIFPSKDTTFRLLVGINLLKKFKINNFAISGTGLFGSNEWKSFFVFKNLLPSQTKILLDKKARTTFENVVFVKKLQTKFKNIVIVSSYYHLKRIKLLVKKFNLKNVYLYSGIKIRNRILKTFVNEFIYYIPSFEILIENLKILREFLALIYYKFKFFITS